MTPQQAAVINLRAEETILRARGHYEAAVAMQRRADYVESGGDALLDYCGHLDRGAGGGTLEYGQRDGWLVVYAASGAVSLAFTKDRAHALFWLLLDHLDITPLELADIALCLAQAGMPIRKP